MNPETARLIAEVERFGPRLAASGPRADAERRPDNALVSDMAKAGLLRVVVPAEYGGYGLEPADFLRFCEALARHHPSTAWAVMTCNEEAGIASAYLDPGTVIDLFRDHPSTVIAGSGVPKGTVRRCDQGWELTGRWDFVSGSTMADRFVLAAVVVDQAGERVRPGQTCFALVDAADVRIEDTWHTAGLRGTASNDVVVEGLVVAEERCGVHVHHALPRPDSPFYRLPAGLRFPFPKVGIATGTASAAFDEFRDLASGKRPLFARSALADRPKAQIAFAEALARVESMRAWTLSLADELMVAASSRQDSAPSGGGDGNAAGGARISPELHAQISPELHARCRLAASSTVAASAGAIGRIVAESGSSANREPSPLMSLQLDAQAIAGHFMVGGYQVATAGRVLLGLDADDPQF